MPSPILKTHHLSGGVRDLLCVNPEGRASFGLEGTRRGHFNKMVAPWGRDSCGCCMVTGGGCALHFEGIESQNFELARHYFPRSLAHTCIVVHAQKKIY